MEKMVEWLRKNNSEECAKCWEKHWTPFHDPVEVPLPWLIADMSAALNRTVRKVRGGLSRVERVVLPRQSLGTFMRNLITYMNDARDEHEAAPIEAQCVCSQSCTIKKELEYLQDLHPRLLYCCKLQNFSGDDTHHYSEIIADILMQGDRDHTPLYQKIEMLHAVASGKKLKDYKTCGKSLRNPLSMHLRSI